jgi:PKD repeat protein
VVTWIDGYQAPSELSYVYTAHSATYDPLLGVWQRVSFGSFTEIASLTTSSGVVAWSARTLVHPGINVYLNIYNPFLGSWTTDSVSYPRATGSLPALSIREENPAVTWTFSGELQFYGFHPEDNLWYADSWTYKSPFFAAQPLSGTAPLKVYFTDLSIAAQWWSWAFGDGAGTTTERSPSHVFTRPGVYKVIQPIGNNTSSPEQSFTRTIRVSAPLSGTLNLLLND